jgi:hypothetical protein
MIKKTKYFLFFFLLSSQFILSQEYNFDKIHEYFDA